jgi:hypothetical protein
MTERAFPLAFRTTLQLFYQRLSCIKIRKYRLCILTPKHRSMLHSRARNALYFRKVRALVFQPLEHEINGIEEQRGWCKDLTLCRVGEDALLDTIFREIGVKVDFGLVDKFEIGAYYNA